MHGRSPTPLSKDNPEEIPTRWQHIGQFLRIDDATGWVDADFLGWSWRVENRLSPVERAVAYEEWADFYEWCLERRSVELASDRVKRHLVEAWTECMVFGCRRSASWARGVDPGEWVPQVRRRPELHAEGQAIVAEIIAELDLRRGPTEHLATV